VLDAVLRVFNNKPRGCYVILQRASIKGTENFEGLGMDGRIILKDILKK
jgi:hypothetical protein